MFNEFLSKRINERGVEARFAFFAVGDILLICLSVFLAFLLRFDGVISSEYFDGALQGMVILALGITLPVFYFFKLYSLSWSYISVKELISLFKAVSLSLLLSGVIVLVFRESSQFLSFPRSILFISYFLIFLFCGGFRFSKKIYFHLFKTGNKQEKSRALIVGAGDAGEQILRSIINLDTSPYLPVGFVDDNKFKQGNIIHGIKVLGTIDDIPRIIEKHQVEEMIIALASADSGIIRSAVNLGRNAGLKKIKIVPSIDEIINNEVSIGNIRDVQVEDLLGRESISLDKTIIQKFIYNKKILITGGAGSIGSELCRQVCKFNPSLLLILDQDETGIFYIEKELKSEFPELKIIPIIADITNKEKIDKIFKKFTPDIIFHAAAYKHVPLMEQHFDEAVSNNIFGTRIVAECSAKYNAEKFIFISTDKAVKPSSVMGATKRIGEMICQLLNKEANTQFVSVRFGNVLGSRGSVIPVFAKQIKKRQQIEITHPDMKRYFMITSEACLLVMTAGAIGMGGEVFVLDMGSPVKILDLAKEMIRLSGLEPDKDIPIVYTGIRPGEKFFEELLTAEEGVVATQNQKIFMAKLSETDKDKINQALIRLNDAINNFDEQEIINIFTEIVPFYKRTE